MWKIHLKQICYLLKENKFFSVVYILGTALSITMVMLVLMAYHLKTGNIGEEDKRDRMLYMHRGIVVNPDKPETDFQSAFLNAGMVEKCFYPLKTPEAFSLFGNTSSVVYNERSQRYEVLTSAYSDAGFWKLYSMRFIEGRPFTEEEVKGKAQKVVIDDYAARRLFGTTQAVGHTLHIDWKEYTVCGVVKEVPSYLSGAHSHLYYPYTTTAKSAINWGTQETPLGAMLFYLLLHDKDDRQAVTQEIEHQLSLINGNKKKIYVLRGQPFNALELALRMGSDVNDSLDYTYHKLYMVIGVMVMLLVIPALNLSGLIVARMRKRAEEIGVRKAFGASTGNLLWQILLENFVQMLLGGVLGLLFSAGLFQAIRFALSSDFSSILYASSYTPPSSVSFWHLVDPVTVCYVIVVCFLLNLISTLLPAWRYTRMPIVEALNRK